MADPLSVTTSIIALAGFALQTSKTLYTLLDSFKSNRRSIRELREELESLQEVLESLKRLAAENEGDLESLKLPLFRCGKICEEFAEVIEKCTSHSQESRTSFRDWTKLQYKGDDITKFKVKLSEYKATISIALASATFRTVAITANVLKEYKDLVDNTTSDLSDHLEEVEQKLQDLSSRNVESSGDISELQAIEEERRSIQQCLQICTQVSSYIEEIQFGNPKSPSSGLEGKSLSEATKAAEYLKISLATKLTGSTLEECKARLHAASSQLRVQLESLDSKIRSLSKQRPNLSTGEAEDLKRFKEERDSITQCLAICTEASDLADNPRTNVFEDIQSADSSHQVIVSTLGDLITARRVSAESGSAQWLGQMSDETLRCLAEKYVPTAEKENRDPGGEKTAGFANRYGAGHQLNSRHGDAKRSSPSGSR
ncbi:hypothetical protein DTO166G4_2254 [Paecilomyces variotii]|uniref:Azaphilone pigments biosynthesis cluster protein L N-terminal domain-containing protein n=1 Tax=Byssochlamys spectabilis TaxID=264951 RepID=A0A443I173_BYSSP|nr:hypothetical protein C8Q69DRAFT_151044 [Paecilomyces variotii]KAJ9216010.1 hypothetical protein DTO166G4_2254 [Paecilomyces variotii]KAJ9219244.1 hypothetical protein DTO169C6_8437 [Paecilomyces variotii]KAJ9240793.1 hypothetical protein DTO166G5_1602 [Paecilomyces variotii]KAJ9244408.1 hypothetical protein DTO169E5_1626 [Paecilomyces variotii]KAJ9247214.1 hypothetical protein DTO207G8_8273 [Paecilomyces variotii]